MTSLDPSVLGWQEFWLRVGLLTFAVAFGVLLTAFTVKLALTVAAGLGWMSRKLRGR